MAFLRGRSGALRLPDRGGITITDPPFAESMIARLSEIWPEVERAALDAGALCIGASDLVDDHAAVFSDWIDAGHHASMAYLAKNREIRVDPASRFPWAKSVIAISVPYSADRATSDPAMIGSRIARYAQGDDYHDVLDRILRQIETVITDSAPGSRSWRYVDTGPLSDRAVAAQSGLGWIGRSGMLIDPDHGSWFFIGTLVTSLENDIAAEIVADRCGSCTHCLEACPTNAILPGRIVASDRCISYRTIEHRGEFEAGTDLAGNLFGCDICQEVCPWNAAPAGAHQAFTPRAEYRATPVTDLLRMEQSDFSSLFRKSAVKRAKLVGMRRNAEKVVEEGIYLGGA